MTDEDTSEKNNRIWKPCPECGSHNVKKDRWTLSFFADVVCQECGNREEAKEMHVGRKSDKSFREAFSEVTSTHSDIELTPKEKLWNNIGMLLVVLGALVSLTLIGAVIGIPMIIIGMLISSKAGPDIDEIEFSCPECGTALEHDTEECPECGETGLRINKSRTRKQNSD